MLLNALSYLVIILVILHRFQVISSFPIVFPSFHCYIFPLTLFKSRQDVPQLKIPIPNLVFTQSCNVLEMNILFWDVPS
jgi:hypothetical protein